MDHKERRIEIQLSLPKSVAEALMLHIYDTNNGEIETYNNDKKHFKNVCHQFNDGTIIRKLPMKILSQALKKRND